MLRAGVGILARRGAVQASSYSCGTAPDFRSLLRSPQRLRQVAVTGFPLMALASGREATPATVRLCCQCSPEGAVRSRTGEGPRPRHPCLGEPKLGVDGSGMAVIEFTDWNQNTVHGLWAIGVTRLYEPGI